MHIVLESAVYAHFISGLDTVFLSEEENLIHNIFQNPLAKIFLSTEIIEFCETSASENNKENVRMAFMQRLFNPEKSFTMPTTETNLTAQFMEVAEKCTEKCVIPIVKTDFEVENDKITLKNDKIVAISEMQKTNKHWQRIKLAAYNTFTVRYLDFENRTEIASFFRTIFNTTNFEKVQIFDRYMQNIVKHNNFKYLSDNNTPTEYYSLKLPSKNLTNGDLNDISLVTSSNIQFFTTEIEDNIHERTLAFSSILIETNDDFSQLKPERQTWRIDVTYSHVLYAALLAKTSHFTNHIF